MTAERAVLAGGCFWGMQDLIRRYDGVLSTRAGYTGGSLPRATYGNHGSHTVTDASQGVQLATTQALARYWGTAYDWPCDRCALPRLGPRHTGLAGTRANEMESRNRSFASDAMRSDGRLRRSATDEARGGGRWKRRETERSWSGLWRHSIRRDKSGYLELYAPDCMLHGYAGVAPGEEGIRQFYQQLWAAFPDGTVSCEGWLEGGDRIALRFTFRGTHRREFQELPPTGRAVMKYLK